MHTLFMPEPQTAPPIEPPLAWLYRSEAFAEDLLDDDDAPPPPLGNWPRGA